MLDPTVYTFVAQATWRAPGMVDLGLRFESGLSWIQSRIAVHCRMMFYLFVAFLYDTVLEYFRPCVKVIFMHNMPSSQYT